MAYGVYTDMVKPTNTFGTVLNDQAVAINERWFPDGIENTASDLSKIRITLVVEVAAVIEVTLDNGTTWARLNSSNALVANSFYVFDVPIRLSGVFNIRSLTATNVRICFLDQFNVES